MALTVGLVAYGVKRLEPATFVRMENVGQQGIGRPAELAFGNRVRELRLARGLTQEALAAWMTAAGYVMHQTTLAKIESGGRPTSVGELAALATVFEVTAAELLAVDTPSDYAMLAAIASRITMQERELAALVERQETLRAQIAADKDAYEAHRVASVRSMFEDPQLHLDHVEDN